MHKFQLVYDRVQASFVDSVPLHLHYLKAEKSIFQFCSQTDIELLDARKAQHLLKKKCIIVKGMPLEPRGFTRAGLRTLATLDSVIMIESKFNPSKFSDHALRELY